MSEESNTNDDIRSLSNGSNLQSYSRRELYLTWAAAWLFLIILNLYPIRTSATRFGLISSLLVVWFGAIVLSWKRKWLRFPFITVTVLLALFVVLPGRPIEPSYLREEYIRKLQTYEGTRYIWGGESHRGIDCSGLIRCGLTDACFQQGLSSLNPGLIRRSFSLWWNDASARELKDGYRQETNVIGESKGINDADYSPLRPGDFAVTNDGVHTLAYIGSHVWIEADPGEGRVIKVTVPSTNPWFKRPVKLVRWSMLEP